MSTSSFCIGLSKRFLAYTLVLLFAALLGSVRLTSPQVRASHFITSVQINDSTIQRGQNGTVTIDLTAEGGADPENTVGFSLNFDATQLAFIGAVPGSGAVGASLTINQSQLALGHVGIALALGPGTGFTAGTHQILVITMVSLANGTALSTSTSFGDAPIARELVSANVQSLPATWTGGNATLVNGCLYTITPSTRNFSAKVGTGTVTITTTPGCPWTVSNLAIPFFVTITSATNGIGNGAVSFDVFANSGAARTGQVYIAGNLFTVAQGANFADVAQDDVFYDFIGKISAAKITVGCSTNPILYCPLNPVTREQMAAFIIRGLGEFNPAAPAFQRFVDVPPTSVFYPFIDAMAVRGITAGCSVTPALYCPSSNVTREQMAVFMIRGAGNFNPVLPASQRFNDVPPSSLYYRFIDDMAVRGITVGCSTTPPLYCPSSNVTRGQMAVFLTRTFGL